MKMPPLPTPVHIDRIGYDSDTAYTAEQMRAYGEAVREECAKACESLQDGDGDWKHGTPASCAAAIRQKD